MSIAGHICPECNKELSTKYTLANHLRLVHRIGDAQHDDEVEELKCSSMQCDYKTRHRKDQRRHISKCVFVRIDNAITQAKSELQNECEIQIQDSKSEFLQIIERLNFDISDSRVQIARLQSENQVLQRELIKAQEANQILAKEAINRPTTTNNQHNNNLKITNYLTDHQSYLSQTQPHRVRDMLDQHLETYFMDGQSGLARFLVEHIIKMNDGKLILVCTDTSRKRFRFVNADGKMVEDMKAKMLCTKLSVPVREMCNEVFDRIINKLKSDKKVKISNGSGAFEIDFLEKKMEWAEKKFIEIRSFDYDDDNTDFLNELAALLRNPSGDDENDEEKCF